MGNYPPPACNSCEIGIGASCVPSRIHLGDGRKDARDIDDCERWDAR